MNNINTPVTADSISSASDVKQTVLIVDDSKVIRLALSKILRKQFEVIQAVDGEDAWHKLSDHNEISAVFSDISMPNLDGFGLLERVRQAEDSHIAQLPFIIITANDDDDELKQRVASAGGSDLVTKPFKTDEITACIDTHILSESETASGVTEQAASTDMQAEQTLSDKEVVDILGLERDVKQPAVSEDSSAIANASLSEPESVAAADEQETGFGVEFSIDESFINSENEESHSIQEAAETDVKPVDSEAQPVHDAIEQSLGSVLSEWEENTLMDIPTLDQQAESSTDLEMEFEAPTEENEMDLDLSLEFAEPERESSIESPASENTDEITAMPVEPMFVEEAAEESDASTASEISDKKLKLEQARKRAMDIARHQAESEHENSTEEQARRNSETMQIRKELERIRQKEQSGGGHEQGSSGKGSLFLRKFMRIITLSFLFRRKK